MSISALKRCIASVLVVSLTGFATPVGASPTTATLSGTVLGDDVATPLSGVTVVVTDAEGHRLASAPTGVDGAFSIANLHAGATTMALETPEGSFPIATPVVLAPGQTAGVRVALKGKADEKEKKKKRGGAPPPDGGKGLGAMIAVLVGFVAAGAWAISQSDDQPSASPSTPEE